MKINKVVTVLIIVLFSMFGCNKKKKTPYKKTPKNEKKEISNIKEHPGKKLLKTQCFLCHHPTAPEKSRIGPPMIAIKAHYIQEQTTKEKFIKEFVDFVKKPTKEKAKLNGAVKRFGLMPNQNYKEAHLKQIAEYLYDFQIEEPSWFREHWQEHQGKPYINKGKKSAKVDVEKSPADIGLEYALGTKKVLGKNLMGTIQKKGTLEALQFCNEKAYSFTDSMAVKFNATIKRVSDKPRNPENLANEKELTIINKYKKRVAAKTDIEPITETINRNTQFYYPIVTNSMCLQCHGKPNKQIKPTTLEKLAELYPNDKAKGYDVNAVRGIWSITFKNE